MSTSSANNGEMANSTSNPDDEEVEETVQAFTPYEFKLRKLYFIDNVKRGLLNMELLYDAINRPLDNPKIKVIHIAGTNGKGSVTLKMSNTLQLAGYKVGMVTSPHISSYRERIQINNQLISESDVSQYLDQILTICEEKSIPATFFEITTALAFLYLAESNVDFIVLETGLGGRLDATNVIPHPLLCIITSIGLEHTALLGDTVEKIAVEKAGIIKKNVPVLVGPNVPHGTIRQCALEKEAEGYYVSDDIIISNEKNSHDNNVLIVNGKEYVDYDAENSRTAAAAIKLIMRTKAGKTPQDTTTSDDCKDRDHHSLPMPVTDDHINKGTSQRPLCRFEEIQYQSTQSLSERGKTKPIKVILDIAHNPPAMDLLIGKLQVTYPKHKKRIVVGFSADKDLQTIAEALLSTVPDSSYIHLVEANNLRAAKLEEIFEKEPRLQDSNYNVADRSIANQVKSALDRIELNRNDDGSVDEILVICGSVFLMTEAREAVGIEEPRDSSRITDVAGSGLQKCKERLMLKK